MKTCYTPSRTDKEIRNQFKKYREKINTLEAWQAFAIAMIFFWSFIAVLYLATL